MTSDDSASTDIVVNGADRKLEITWADGERNEFHFVWLRHNARCSHGMPNDTSVKIDLIPDDPTSLVIDACRIESGLLVIDWQDDGLQTTHEFETLRRSAYDQNVRMQRKHQPKLWDRDNADQIPAFENDQLQSEDIQLEFLLAVRDYGVAMLRGVPTTPGSVAEVAARFGPMHVNNYGGIFDVKSVTVSVSIS